VGEKAAFRLSIKHHWGPAFAVIELFLWFPAVIAEVKEELTTLLLSGIQCSIEHEPASLYDKRSNRAGVKSDRKGHDLIDWNSQRSTT
jgi:hypothetical protein